MQNTPKNKNTDTRAPKRVQNELRFRAITVANKTLIADSFWRVDFISADLAGFNSAGFDDHTKIFFPDAGSSKLQLPQVTEQGIVWETGKSPISREYTPLFFDGKEKLTLDFYIHNGGVASDWATQAKIGDELVIGGPRGSLVVPDDYGFQLYVTDETGLPAFKRRKASLQAEECHLFAFTEQATGHDYLEDLDGITVNWLGSGNMSTANLGQLIALLDNISIPTQDYFIWLTGEGQSVKMLSDYFTQRKGCDPTYVRAVAYWHQK
ncbi:siderophore-interacting protein [Budvicia aquatica]|uniref:NADPH-dependent ferric-chelate reductase n=1 Tax=Budvicia aquatica TaxID=82979 RepID=A0A2C6DJZ4_9GAMM|nr:siderophore-interacting protein [Budvicia aquatica]PHI30638.1 siderophore-interacting protein [Budvicia aquatica]VFS50126.1 NADPH-dependent ferric-chelate reductase [Budvicia aquatica]